MTFRAHYFLDCLSRIDGRQKSLDVKSWMFIWKKGVGTAWIGEGKNLGLRQPYSPVCKCVGEKHLNGTHVTILHADSLALQMNTSFLKTLKYLLTFIDETNIFKNCG